ncbi:MAG: cytidine deaminase [Lachnospiraceae bacterium]|nr:cytidine deaminase [Lachnospiraceae bacterium]
MMTDTELLAEAEEARKNSYAPYSGFTVGAALLSKDGRIFRGCNMENAAFTPGICAERTAIYKAVSEGVRDFDRIAITGGRQGESGDAACPPCGVCRQVLREFCDPESFRVIVRGPGGSAESHTLGEFLPMSFGPDNL